MFNQSLLLHAELIPANNTIVRELPATFYCRVTDTTGTVSDSMLLPQWFIDGNPVGAVQGPYEVMLPPGAPNNLTVVSSFIPITVSCRIMAHPNVDLGVFRVGECLVRNVYKIKICVI